MTTLKNITLGEKLKKRRQELNLSLKEAETATSIRTNYLQAIEDGKVLQLISPIYAQGFIKQYAIFLNLDGEQLLREHPEALPRQGKHEFNYGIGTLEMRNSPSSGVKWVPNALWIGILFVVLLAAWYLARLLEVI